jgi:hypothetical protein
MAKVKRLSLYLYGSNTVTFIAFSSLPITVSFDVTLGDEWIKFNVNESGYYRVNYWPAMWERIATQLNTGHQVYRVLFKILNIENIDFRSLSLIY